MKSSTTEEAMRRKRNVHVNDDEPALDISSLIDVCFLLLIYFIVTSTMQPREQDLPMTLPTINATNAPIDRANSSWIVDE